MGDRSNIKIKQHNGVSMYLYFHWAGTDIVPMLKEALTFGKQRWDDDTYLARIIVTRCSASMMDELTGCGLSTFPTDNEHNVLEVDLKDKAVRVLSKARWHDETCKWESLPPAILREFTFDEFCAMDLDTFDLDHPGREVMATT